jgi:hypothetical protein
MADDFDPDAYLHTPSAGQEKPFDPDQYLRSTPADKSMFFGSSALGDRMERGEYGPVAQTIANIPSSAVGVASAFAQPFIHPIETATAIKNIGQGALEKAGIMSGDEHVKYADAVGKFLVDRYGSIENATHTLVHDPVGVMADVSMLFTGGGSLAARAPSWVGKIGEVAGAAGRVVDPLTLAAKTAQGVGSVAGKVGAETIGRFGTHTGAESLATAARAGYEGGPAAEAFRESMRGQAPMEEVVADARGAVQELRRQRGQAYRDSMAQIGADTTVLDFAKIDSAVNAANAVKTYKGQSLSPSTQAIRDSMSQAIGDWKALDPAQYHTAEGLDALKQKIGDIRDGTQYGTPERVAADRVYNAVRQTIIDQAPDYAKAMKGYEQASTQIKEIERTLSLNPNASVDTALRKLQSVLRNNVNANYGQRAKLADYLVNAGAPQLMEKLAGQTLSSWTPRGFGALIGSEVLALTGGLLAHGVAPAALGPAIGALPFMSPRLMGEASYLAGRAAAPVARVPARPIGHGAFQTGRITQPRILVTGEPGAPLTTQASGGAVKRAAGGSVAARKARVAAILRRYGVGANTL